MNPWLGALFLYLGLSLSANAADVTLALEARSGGMKALRIHEEPRAVAFVRFEDFEGNAMSLADYQGKLLVVNFWATWCAPCRKEMPMFSELQAELQDELGADAFEVVTLATGRNSPSGMARFFESIGVENLPLHRDPKQKVAQAMGVLGLPTTVILSPDGQELARMQGEADWSSDSAKNVIRALMDITHPKG